VQGQRQRDDAGQSLAVSPKVAAVVQSGCTAAPGQRLSPRRASTVLCNEGALTASGATAGAATSSTRDQKRFGSLASALPSLWLKKLPHRPRNAIGTTGTGLRAMIFSMPLRNSSSSPSEIGRASGRETA